MLEDAEGWGVEGAEGKEINNHRSKGSWRYILRAELPRGRRVVKLTWVYKTKRDGTKKARLCVQGCTQVPGVDYDQTFCAAMRAGSLRTLCSLSARLGLKMRRWDFVAAYLQGELEPGEVVYCSPPPGYSTAIVDGAVTLVPTDQGDGVDRLCRVERPVYGMAQSGRRWQRTIFPWLLAWRAKDGAQLKQSLLDTCVFSCSRTVTLPSGEQRHEVLLLGCYVDDLCIMSSHDDEFSLYGQLVAALAADWDIEDEGEVADLLSIEITREDDGVVLRQVAYIDKLMHTYAPDGVPTESWGAAYPLTEFTKGKKALAPCDHDLCDAVCNALGQDAKDVDPKLLKAYQAIVGSLLYCAVNTRPDVAYAVGYLCRAMAKPTPETYVLALRVLYYLHVHRRVGLRYSADDLDLSGMSDADWAVRYSTSGYVFQYNMAAISWSSKRQQSVALSSCESEIVALSEAAKEGVYLSEFLTDLGFGADAATAVSTDNTGARALAYNPEHHERVKHVERRHFFVRDCVERHQITVPFVSTVDNLADFFTKPLTGKQFFTLRNRIMNVTSEDKCPSIESDTSRTS